MHRAAESDVDALVAEYERLYEVAAELKTGGARHESLRYSARIELGLRHFLEANGSAAFTTSFEEPWRRCGSCRHGVQRLMADGTAWRRGRLEDRAPGPRGQGHGRGLPGGASLMEDYTYHLTPGQEKILGAT